jgi:hypothetical protein
LSTLSFTTVYAMPVYSLFVCVCVCVCVCDPPCPPSSRASLKYTLAFVFHSQILIIDSLLSLSLFLFLILHTTPYWFACFLCILFLLFNLLTFYLELLNKCMDIYTLIYGVPTFTDILTKDRNWTNHAVTRLHPHSISLNNTLPTYSHTLECVCLFYYSVFVIHTHVTLLLIRYSICQFFYPIISSIYLQIFHKYDIQIQIFILLYV